MASTRCPSPGADVAYEALQQPIAINGCIVPNRIVRTAHATGFALGKVTPRLIAYHEARARGGVGLNFLEIASVHPSSPGPLLAFTDAIIDGYALVADAVHRHGNVVFQQLWHGGSNAAPIGGGPAWAPSTVPEPINGTTPVAMTATMIDDVVAGFADAARRCHVGGLDGVELHAAHGYLAGQFLSPLTNRRTDDYGGTLENRTLFLRRCLAAIRAAVGHDYPVGVRLSGSEGVEGGIQPDEASATASLLERCGLIDFCNVSLGSYYAFSKFIGAMHEPLGYELATSTPVTAAVSVPTIVTGRIMDLHDADQLVRNGVADLVSMVRANIADPDIVTKSFAGERDRVRPCISCNQGCVGGLFGPTRSIGCAVNPEAGFEHLGVEQFPVAALARRILVVGGGIAGMEAAYTAARRGHHVVLADAGPRLGGVVVLARRAPHREDLGAIADWLADELHRLGVEVRLDAAIGVDDVAGFDAVIVATGGEPRRDGRQRFRPASVVAGIELAHVVTPLDVLANRTPPSSHALVFDDFGHVVAVSVAEHLLGRGSAVTLVTSLPSIAHELGPSLQREPYQARLGSHRGFTALTRQQLVAITDDHVRVRGLDNGIEQDVAADLVVVDTGVEPRRALYDSLVRAGVDVHLAGDALAARDLQHAIASGRAVGRLV